MFSCDHLYHPFLNDPGTSQDQRLPAALSEDSPAIDSREISDFLNYFAALSHQINFYDARLNVSDWGPFFSGDMPFLLSSMASTDTNALKDTLNAYTKLFTKRPSAGGLQLLFLYNWYSIVYPIQQWAAQLQNSGLPLEQTLGILIRDRLPAAIKSFISWMNTAVKCFCIAPVDMTVLLQNNAWGLQPGDLTVFDEEFSCTGKGSRSQLLALQSSLSGLTDSFTEVLNLAGSGAADQVNEQFYGLLQTTGQQVIRPHLALLYSFLNQYLNVLDDLNGLTDKHLAYFFQTVLQLAPGGVKPDQAYVVFSLQKTVPNYPLEAGLSLKDGKDSKNADIYFALDAPITVTQTQATNFSTLFVNSPVLSIVSDTGGGNASTITRVSYVEGVYMAPDATKADGLTQPFADPSKASWPTLGAKVGKYTPPMAQGPVNYPSARLGFILASKVLLMNEGERKVHIRLACRWTKVCDPMDPAVARLFMSYFTSGWLIITQALLDQAMVLGLKQKTASRLREHYLRDRCRKKICKDDDQPTYLPYRLIELRGHKTELIVLEKIAEVRESQVTPWLKFMNWQGKRFGMETFELGIWKSLLLPRPVFELAFSGAKGWVAPAHTAMDMAVPADAVSGDFELNLYALIEKDQDAVTFADKGVLGEDFGTTDALVKVQLNDAIKVPLKKFIEAAGAGGTVAPADPCCLRDQEIDCGGLVSFYTFFRNVIILGEGTGIDISVCGVKNLVVQNDDNVLSAKSPFTPFGVKPVVPDFDSLHHPPKLGRRYNLVGPNFYIGSAEVFLKKWTRANINMNWKGVPRHFRNYYRAYFRFWSAWSGNFPKHEVSLALLQDGNWDREKAHPHVSQNPFTLHNNRPFFSRHRLPVAGCADQQEYEHSFHIVPDNFQLESPLKYDATFAPLKSYSNGVLNGYLRMTMENQDFLHKLYPIVMAERMIERARGIPAPLPNEPWTPTILDIAIDYEASADAGDMKLIQLYPFDGTYDAVDINGEPTLFASFCDEGNLFIGLSGLVPGDGLNMLFYMAEATADTEGGAVTIGWQYLAGNQWEPLRTGFEIVEDNTNGLSTTGIIQYSFPDDITNDNTIMPAGTYWIRASVAGGAEAASQTMKVITQAARASFVNDTRLNDQTRPGNITVSSGSITKLTNPDPNVQSVSQPFDSFGGSATENYDSSYNIRVSEQLRHKGRAIQKWDYERMVLQQFSKILRVKCINHSYALSSQEYKWDFPMAPGNIILAVLPDPAQLAVTDSLQPTVPMSMLTAIEDFLSGATTPFARVFATNPRYEPIDMCLEVSLLPDMNVTYYQAQLQQDIRKFMAPWKQDNPDAFEFAQRFYSAALVNFIQNLAYIASLAHLEMAHQGQPMQDPIPDYLDPLTPRSILVAGKIVIHIKNSATNKTIHGRKH